MEEGNKGSGSTDIEALKELAEIAAELKKSGILGALKELVESADALMEGIEDDRGLLRLGVLVGALLEAARRIDGSEVASLKMNVEDAGYCVLEALASAKPGETGDVGILGLLKALNDPQVRRGLGYLLAVAKGLGACIEKL